MDAKKVLEVVTREMTAIGYAYRLDWSEFDGRTLRSQLESLAGWADKAINNPDDSDYIDGTAFLKRTEEDCGF